MAVDTITLMYATIKEGAFSQQIEVDNLSGRADNLETCEFQRWTGDRVREFQENIFRPSHAVPDWEPSGSCETKIRVLGDSNSTGKLKFKKLCINILNYNCLVCNASYIGYYGVVSTYTISSVYTNSSVHKTSLI